VSSKSEIRPTEWWMHACVSVFCLYGAFMSGRHGDWPLGLLCLIFSGLNSWRAIVKSRRLK